MKQILWAAGLLLLLDLGYSFYEYYNTPLGGDIAEIVYPKPGTGYYEVLHDPIGMDPLLNGTKYPNPNRFFAHYISSKYMLHVPVFLQNFMNPLDSVYMAAAIAKWLTHLLFLYVFFLYISSNGYRISKQFILIGFLATPFFQAFGYNRFMGIIDQSIIYNFFYAIPLAIFLVLFLPFFKFIVYKQNINLAWWHKTLLILSVPFLTLNGPLIPGIILIVCPILLIHLMLKNFDERTSKPTLKAWYEAFKIKLTQRIPSFLLLFFVSLILLSLYSLYLGTFNSLNDVNQLSLIERYARLPLGIFYLISQKIGFSVLFAAIAINYIFIYKRLKIQLYPKAIVVLKIVGIFSLIYILLLPLGGFRSYRANIIRYDTFLPITIALIFVFVSSTYAIIKSFNTNTDMKLVQQKRYNIHSNRFFILYILCVLFIFSFADRVSSDSNTCERELFSKLADSKSEYTVLPDSCTLMEWNSIKTYEQSELNARLFYYWNITDKLRLYRQE